MASFKISQIIQATGGKLLQGNPNVSGRGIVTNSRLVKKGNIFIAIVGEKHDAHHFIAEVIKKGAAAVVVSRDIGPCPVSVAVIKVVDTTKALGEIARLHRLRFCLPVIAITGSAGKTTTKEMIAAVLKRKFKVLKNVGTENNQFGVPLTLLKLKPADQIAVLEVGTNRPGDIAWLASIVCPSIVVMTNIGESHLALLKTPADVFKEKFNLVKALDPKGTVVVNADDPYLKKIVQIKRKNTISFGIAHKANYQARQIKYDGRKVYFSISGMGEITLQGTATANVYNALAAIAIGRLFGVNAQEIKNVLKSFSLKSGRQTLLRVGKIRIINDSYNANPVSFRSALESLTHQTTRGRKILICADMLELGRQAKRLHQEIGLAAADAGVNAIISFGKFSQWIGRQAKKKNPAIEIFHAASEQQLQATIKKSLCPSDIVLVKGSRGMRTERFVEFIQTQF